MNLQLNANRRMGRRPSSSGLGLNFNPSLLCKRCNQKAVSSDIKEAIIEKQQKALEAQKERQEQKKEEIIEKQVLEEEEKKT